MQLLKKTVAVTALVLGVLALVAGAARETVAQVRAALVRDMDSPIRGTRYMERINDDFGAGQFSSAATLVPVVPAGKRLFLQRVSIELLLTDNQAPQNAILSLSQASAGATIKIDQRFQGGATQRHYIGNEDLDILLNAGESITVSVFRNDNLGNNSTNFWNATVVGYLIDANP